MSWQVRASSALLLSSIISCLLRILGPLVGGTETAHVYTEMILRQLLTWGLPSLLMARRFARPHLWRMESADGMTAIFAGAAVQYALAPVTQAIHDFLDTQPSALPMPAHPLEWVLGVLALVIVPAVVEEVYFRGGVLGSLARDGASLMAVSQTAVIFAALHASLAGTPAYLTIGLMLGMTMYGSQSLLACILMHAAYNACALWWTMVPVSHTALGYALSALAAAVFLRRMWRNRPLPDGRPTELIFFLAMCLAILARLV